MPQGGTRTDQDSDQNMIDKSINFEQRDMHKSMPLIKGCFLLALGVGAWGAGLLIPFAGTYSDQDATDTGDICQRDLATLRQTFRVECPLFALVCGWLAFLPSVHPAVAWMAFGFLGALPIQYMPLLVASFPAHYAGRVSTSPGSLAARR